MKYRVYSIIIILTGSLLLTTYGYAQTFKVNLSPKHLSKIESGKSAREKLKKYRKFFSKDSAKQMKKHEKYYSKKSDSITRAVTKEEKQKRRAERKGIKTPIDTLEFLKQYADFLPRDSASSDSLKSKGLQAARAKAMDNLPGDEKEKLQALQSKYGLSPDEAKEFLSGDTIARKKLKEKSLALAKEKGMENIPEAERRQLESIQNKYGLSPVEAKEFLSSDSTARKKLKVKGLQKAKEKSLANLPAGQRKQVESFQKEYGPYSTEVKQYLFFLKDSVDRTDTLKAIAAKRAEALATKMVGSHMGGAGSQMNQYTKQLEEMKNSPQKYKEQVENYKDPEKLKASAKEKGSEQALAKFGEQADKLKAAQDKMGFLKKKFSTLLNSNDLSTGIKAKSLEGRPLRERWVIGGNFNIANTAPLMIDLSPQFGYRIDKRFQVGISGIYRAKFVDSVKIANALPADVYGYSVFSSYGLMLNFFGYAEWERTSSTVKTSVQTSPSGPPDPKVQRQWTNSLLVGLGRQFAVHPKVKGSILLLWNPLHKNGRSPYHDAFVVKTGFQLSELALLKKR